MSSPTPTPAPVPPPHMAPAPPPPAVGVSGTSAQEIRIVSHSGMFYWWPVWAVGFVMALLTFVDGHRMALVPGGVTGAHAEARRDFQVVVGVDEKGLNKTDTREGILVEKGKGRLLPDKVDPQNQPEKPYQPHLHMAANSSYGVVFATVLLLVIFITNVPLRGLWSIVVIVFTVLMIVIFALADWWTTIFHYLSILDIRVNMAGYFFISSILLGMWLLTNLFFDRQIYTVFTPGQLRVCQEIGGGETAFDTQGMVVEKHRDDLFRHWVLGLGSGDLTVKTSGANPQVFHLHNVLFVGRKLQLIEEMQREKAVVKG